MMSVCSIYKPFVHSKQPCDVGRSLINKSCIGISYNSPDPICGYARVWLSQTITYRHLLYLISSVLYQVNMINMHAILIMVVNQHARGGKRKACI